MTEDNNRLETKRQKCRELLDLFREYYLYVGQAGHFIIYMGLLKEIRNGDEAELDRLIIRIDEMNQKKLMEKLSS